MLIRLFTRRSLFIFLCLAFIKDGIADQESIRTSRGYRVLSMAELSSYLLQYDVAHADKKSAQKANKQIPAWVRSLDGTNVELEGYMIPLDLDGQRVTTFVLAHNSSGCCFGTSPKINGWVYVETTDKTKGRLTFSDPTLEVEVYGRLHVGLPIDPASPASVYRLTADETSQPGASSLF